MSHSSLLLVSSASISFWSSLILQLGTAEFSDKIHAMHIIKKITWYISRHVGSQGVMSTVLIVRKAHWFILLVVS